MRSRLYLLLLAAPLAAAPVASSAPDLPGTVPARPISGPTAFNWAVAGTLGPVLAGTALAAFSNGSEVPTNMGVGMILVGLGIGPSLGQFYAGSYIHGFAATAMRGLGAALVVAGAVESTVGRSCEDRTFEAPTCRDRGGPIALAGTFAYFGGVAYSLVETHFAVRRRNSRPLSALGLAPTLSLVPHGFPRTGLVAQVRF